MGSFLLPYRWKIAGIVMAIAGMAGAAVYGFFDFRFKVPVFAVVSIFVEPKFFTVFQTNFSEEVVLFFLITGLNLIIFSKERNEAEALDTIRLKAFAKAIITNAAVQLFAVLFIYGAGFAAVMVFNLLSVNILYLIFFYRMRWSLLKN